MCPQAQVISVSLGTLRETGADPGFSAYSWDGQEMYEYCVWIKGFCLIVQSTGQVEAFAAFSL